MDGSGTLARLTIEGTARRRLAGIPPGAPFLSQLIAERQRLMPQRARRRATPLEAFDAYAEGTGRTVRRLPAGYRRTITA